MKCIVLAGGKGDRLWPLSRKNYPKQFIQIQGDHSIFQETIARNIPYCDEFIIVTNMEYQFIVENQISAFQGLTHRYVFEGVGRKTAAAITLACMQLPLSETVLVVPADQLIAGNEYKDDLLCAKQLSLEGKLVTFGMPVATEEERFGYIKYSGQDVLEFVEKPDRSTAHIYGQSGQYLVNSGMFVFCVGNYLQELKQNSTELYTSCQRAYLRRTVSSNGYIFTADVMQEIPALAIEKAVFEKTKNAKVVHGNFNWKDIGSLEDLSGTKLQSAMDGPQLQYKCRDVDIINHCSRRLVVANEIENAVIVNTKDAVYVGRKETSNNLKAIIEDNPHLSSYFECGRVNFRQWGSYELLVDTPDYRVKKVIINPGRTIYAHKHLHRSEHWSVVSGQALIDLDGNCKTFYTNDVIEVPPEIVHQVSNVGNEALIIIEVSVGKDISEEDKVSDNRENIREDQMGKPIESFIKLLPAFKDYLWGGTKLRDIYGKKCDYEIIAESWELSAHEAGQSIVANGRHKGMAFAEYLEVIGKPNWGWKCQPLDSFPILIKFIDAKSSLSIQVHPNDDYALFMENQYGKNEMWYIIDCEPDAYIYCGFNRDVTREEVARRLIDNTILDILNKIPVKKGEAYFIPAGTVHAIGGGILICEIQQSSNCTYRLYDYCRKDKFGNLRQLHIDKALDVLKFEKYEPQILEDAAEKGFSYKKRVISRCKYFECILYSLNGVMELPALEESFTSLICISGRGCISLSTDSENGMDFTQGESIFMPKSTDLYLLEGQCEFIITRI